MERIQRLLRDALPGSEVYGPTGASWRLVAGAECSDGTRVIVKREPDTGACIFEVYAAGAASASSVTVTLTVLYEDPDAVSHMLRRFVDHQREEVRALDEVSSVRETPEGPALLVFPFGRESGRAFLSGFAPGATVEDAEAYRRVVCRPFADRLRAQLRRQRLMPAT